MNLSSYTKVGSNEKGVFALSFLVVAGLFMLTLSTPHAYASGFVPLTGIPLPPDSTGGGLPRFLNGVYVLLLSLAGIFAVVKITLAGFKYSLSEIANQKTEAKNEILMTILGLILILMPFVVLSEINPNLVNLDVLKGTTVPKVNMKAPSAGPGNQNTTQDTTQNTNYGTGNDAALAPGTVTSLCSVASTTQQCSTWCTGLRGTLSGRSCSYQQ